MDSINPHDKWYLSDLIFWSIKFSMELYKMLLFTESIFNLEIKNPKWINIAPRIGFFINLCDIPNKNANRRTILRNQSTVITFEIICGIYRPVIFFS